MKIIKIFLVLCLMHVTHNHGMEIEQLSLWYSLHKNNITQIVAYSDVNTKESLRLVNKQLSDIARENNIENMLSYFPCILSRQHHLDCMVKYAKEKNKEMILQLIKTATYCDHTDWFDVIPYFLPEDSRELSLLKKYYDYANLDALKESLSCIMMIYEGDSKALDQYKIRYGKVPGYASYTDLSVHIHRISPLNIAVARNHPISLILLLLSQNQDLLNVKDDCWGLTPIMVAALSDNVDMCTFLLSYKNIDLIKSMNAGWTLLKQAYHNHSYKVTELLINYKNQHKIKDMK